MKKNWSNFKPRATQSYSFSLHQQLLLHAAYRGVENPVNHFLCLDRTILDPAPFPLVVVDGLVLVVILGFMMECCS